MSIRSVPKSENINLGIHYAMSGGNPNEMAVRLRMSTDAMTALREALSVRRDINGREVGRVEVAIVDQYCGLPVVIDESVWVAAEHAPIADVVAAYHREQAR